MRTPRSLLVLLCLLLLAGVGLLVQPAAIAEDAAEDAADGTSPSSAETPSPQSRWGWKTGPTAAGTGPTLAPVEPVYIALPKDIAKRITAETAVLYFSPTCPHCRHAMPELNELVALQPDLQWLGVATGNSSPAMLEEFTTTFGVDFDMVVDTDRSFAWATGARSTPSLFLFGPAEDGATPTSGQAPGKDQVTVKVFEAFMPYARGTAPIIAMRRNVFGRRVAADRSDAEGGGLEARDMFADFHGYQGTRACASCHTVEGTSWALSHHAGAYMTLYERERTDDLACVGCHVVGLQEATEGPPLWDGVSGFTLGDHSSPHADVGCEACHGPAGPHDGEPAATPAGGTALEACVGCHDEKHSVAFAVEKGMPHVDHYRAVDMDDDEIEARLKALANGTAERPLLAFPTGPTVGSEACKSCHKTEHKGWKKHPHAQAMGSLSADEAQQGECVSCHATAKAFGGMGRSQDVADYRVDEGVGCESCHGPGGEHAADPTLDNIVRLGETCPECVLEGICTSCHTPEWDPVWALQPRLDALPYSR